MRLWSKSATALALLGLLIYPTSAGANNLYQNAPEDAKRFGQDDRLLVLHRERLLGDAHGRAVRERVVVVPRVHLHGL